MKNASLRFPLEKEPPKAAGALSTDVTFPQSLWAGILPYKPEPSQDVIQGENRNGCWRSEDFSGWHYTGNSTGTMGFGEPIRCYLDVSRAYPWLVLGLNFPGIAPPGLLEGPLKLGNPQNPSSKQGKHVSRLHVHEVDTDAP